jgi:uncharacterized phiE125 gp8 family phage protein
MEKRMITRAPLTLDSAMLDETRAYLRIESEEEDPALGGIILAALGHAEAFLNLVLLRRTVTEVLGASTTWSRLGATPVLAISGVSAPSVPGPAALLPPDRYAVDIDGSGDGWVRITDATHGGRIEVSYTAGLASDWASLPEALRLGVLRLAGYLHGHRDGAGDPGPPAAVAALLNPWRRFRLS